MTIQDVTRLIAMCKARYPRANWSPDEMLTIQMWHDALGDLPGEAVLTTAREMMRRSEFPPDPAEIRQ